MDIPTKDNQARDEEFRRARLRMVQYQIAGRDVRNETVLEAMRRVPRHEFVPPELWHEAYDDYPLPIGFGQTISQPYIVGSMTELLLPDKAKTVLEIGTGSGYQTAVLAEVFGTVVTVEIVPELSRQAQMVLNRLEYTSIAFHIGDGLMVPEGDDRFDAIIATAAPAVVPPELIVRLAPGGRMVLPVGAGAQCLKLVTRDCHGEIAFETLYSVRFVPLQRQ